MFVRMWIALSSLGTTFFSCGKQRKLKELQGVMGRVQNSWRPPGVVHPTTPGALRKVRGALFGSKLFVDVIFNVA